MKIKNIEIHKTHGREKMADLAIVGGGPSGAGLLHRLTREGQSPQFQRIDIFEKRSRLGPGAAYAPPDRALLMNTPVSHLNISGDSSDLTNWLAGRVPCSAAGDAYLSRTVYGDYLAHLASAAIKRLEAKNTQVTRRCFEIVDLVKSSDHAFELTASDGQKFFARRVVLALGDPAPRATAAFVGLPGYLDTPGDFAKLAAIPSQAPVIILGAGASAADCCLYLKHNRGHKGVITLASRSGDLPCVLSNSLPPDGMQHKHVLELLSPKNTELSLEQIKTAIQQDLGAWLGAAVSLSSPTDRTPERRFYRDVIRAERCLPGPQDYIRSLRRVAPRLWARLSAESRRTFDRDYRSLWDRYRHPIPLETARPLMALLREKQVRVVKVCDEAHWSQRNFIVPGHDQTSTAQAPYLIQATGPDFDSTRDRSALIRAILRRGLGLADPGGGLTVAHDLRLMAADGTQQDLFLMGSRVRGSKFATASIQSVAQSGDIVAGALFCDDALKTDIR